MKKIIVFLTLITIIAGCSTGTISIKRDSFKNSSLVTLKLNHSPSEFNSARAEAEYIREFSENKITPTIISFRFITNSLAKDIEEKAFIRAGGKTFEVKLTQRSSGTHTDVSSTTTVNGNSGSSSFVDYTGNLHNNNSEYHSETEVSTNSYKAYEGKIYLTEEIEKTILKSKRILYRVYFGTEPATYDLWEGDITKIKEFLLTDPNKKGV